LISVDVTLNSRARSTPAAYAARDPEPTVNEANPMFEDERAAWQEKVDAAKRMQERLGPLAAERARTYEALTLEKVMAR
jgi:sugar-specific transcriptional regulator TrmB